MGAFGGTVFEPDDFTIARYQEKGYRTAASASGTSVGTHAIRRPGAKKEIPGPSPMTGTSASRTVQQGLIIAGDGTINFPPYCWIEGDMRHHSHQARHQVQPLAGVAVAGRWPAEPYDILPAITQKTVGWFEAEKGSTLLRLPRLTPHYPIVPNKHVIKSKAGYYGDFVIETDAWAR